MWDESKRSVNGKNGNEKKKKCSFHFDSYTNVHNLECCVSFNGIV